MSLGLFAGAVVLLQQHRAISVERLAHLLAVSEEAVEAVLRDVYAQGHCTLTHRNHQLISATWRDQPKG